MPIQQMLLGTGVVAERTYMDDVFSTFLYTENDGNTITINNGVDMSEGGMVWFKARAAGDQHVLVDTVRGGTKVLSSSSDSAQSTQSGAITSFNNNGFAIGNYGNINGGSTTGKFASWTFRKAPGFFTICTWTGNATAGRQISHDLGSVPGLILVKKTTGTADWQVFHRSLGATKFLILNESNTQGTNSNRWNNTAPTATHFTLSNHTIVNGSGQSYVAYVFAGGESTNTGSASVLYGGASVNDYSYFNDSSEFDVGTNFTAECWFKADSIPSGTSYNVIMGQWFDANAWIFEYVGTTLRFYYGSSSNYKNLGTTSDRASLGQWHHLAFSKQGTTTRIFLDGTQVVADFDMGTYSVASKFYIGGHTSGSSNPINGCFDGNISNVRVVKDTAVYTSSFRPLIKPLTGISNTVILCCNDASNARGNTVNTTGDYMYSGTSYSSPVAKTDSPFDDPAGFVFGKSGSENVIKCGSYKGSSSADFEVNIGWEPQFIMFKRVDPNSSNYWAMFDSMRGIVTGENENYLYPNDNSAEYSAERISLTATGFIVDASAGALINQNGGDYVYIAIRRPDGYVGKPYGAGEGTSVFAMATAASSTPKYSSGFPVDFAFKRRPAVAESWSTSARLIAKTFGKTDTNAAFTSNSSFAFDSNTHWPGGDGDDQSVYQAWMWKRHAGMDVVAYQGDGVVGRQISHSLNKTVEMIWVKRRDSTSNWNVYHIGLNNGSSPENYYLELNDSTAETQHTTRWNDTAPTSTGFTVGTSSTVNGSGASYIAMLFASVAGISKVGYYTGNGSSQTITVGFQPRFLIVKVASTTEKWYLIDTTRGWEAGNDKFLMLNNNSAQGNSDFGQPTSTGFTVNGSDNWDNANGEKYIYYCHA